ncbi:MAG: hypothetical protein ACK6CT_15475 [Planctomycetia bacterium]|jgi:hypothetical protein
MSDPIAFYRSFQGMLRERAIKATLTSGMACVEYGLQQNTKDTDWILDPEGIIRLVELFGELERGVSGRSWRVTYRGLFGAPLDREYLTGGWTSHIAAFEDPESAERHLDFFGRAPRLSAAWHALADGGIASRDVVARMKKTDRPKDWPLVNGLALQAFFDGEPEAVLHLREPSVLREAWDRTPPSLRASFARERPLLATLSDHGDAELDRLLLVEQLLWQCVNRERYIVYQRAWKAFYRDWQQDRVGEWPTAEPFLLQHRRVCEAARTHALPPAPLASEATRREVFDRGRDRVASLAAATLQELQLVAMPLDTILP